MKAVTYTNKVPDTKRVQEGKERGRAPAQQGGKSAQGRKAGEARWESKHCHLTGLCSSQRSSSENLRLWPMDGFVNMTPLV